MLLDCVGLRKKQSDMSVTREVVEERDLPNLRKTKSGQSRLSSHAANETRLTIAGLLLSNPS